MKHKKSHAISTLFFMIIVFGAGFAFHSFFFPNLQVEEIPQLVSKGQIINKVKVLGQDSDDEFVSAVVYKDGSFLPNHIKMKRGNYITITNQEKEDQMWLESSEPLLNTKRGYAETEQLKTTLNEPGTFTVTNKLKPDAKLEVTVE